MAQNRGKYRAIYIVTAALMAAMIGGYALAATTITTLSPGQNSNITNTPSPGGFAIGSVSTEQIVILTSGMVASSNAGTQTTGAVGLGGTPTALASCGGPPCTPQSFITAVPVTETLGNYAEQIVLNVNQPASTGASSGFDYEITILASSGTVVVIGYLATGLASVTSGQSVPVFLFVDLGVASTATPPTITSLSVVLNLCSSATACP
jgi:hypothetical protein